MNLNDQVAIVTGASRGIGKAIAIALAKAGCHIAGISRTEHSASAPMQEILALGVKYQPYGVDVSDPEAVADSADKIEKDFGRIDILVNNAGITRDTLLMRMSNQDWDEVLKTNLSSAFYWTRAVTRPMMKARRGRIINISSVVGLHGNAGQANYAAAKAGLIGFSKSVARELASRNVTCNVICPGFIETDMTKELSGEVRAKAVELIPMKRMGTGDEIASAAVFLAGGHAAYMTGQVMTIDGGMFI